MLCWLQLSHQKRRGVNGGKSSLWLVSRLGGNAFGVGSIFLPYQRYGRKPSSSFSGK